VTVQVVSNDECKQSPDRLYKKGVQSDSICADVPGGGKDSCQGDSGGPLITRMFDPVDPTKSVHTHVGIVSWGISCADKDFPGVYARTSAGKDWIRENVCAGGNIHPFCQPMVMCGPNESKLTIKVVTDEYPQETSWELKDANGNILLDVMEEELEKTSFTYEDTTCLPPGEYSFSIFDSFGDGLVLENPNSPNYVEAYYSLIFDGVEINTSKGNDFTFDRTFEFTIKDDGMIDATPGPTSAPASAPVCEDDPSYKYNGRLNNSCEVLSGLPSNNKNFYCNKEDKVTGQLISTYCCATCVGFV